MSKFLRFRRSKRLKALRDMVRPPFAERMRRLKPQPRGRQWWAMVAGALIVGGAISWLLVP